MPDNSVSTKLSPQCPIRTTMEMLGGKWRLLIIHNIEKQNEARFRDLKKAIPEISDKVLSDELKTLEENHLVDRMETKNLLITYSLTPIGREAASLIEPIAQFGDFYMKTLHL